MSLKELFCIFSGMGVSLLLLLAGCEEENVEKSVVYESDSHEEARFNPRIDSIKPDTVTVLDTITIYGNYHRFWHSNFSFVNVSNDRKIRFINGKYSSGNNYIRFVINESTLLSNNKYYLKAKTNISPDSTVRKALKDRPVVFRRPYNLLYDENLSAGDTITVYRDYDSNYKKGSYLFNGIEGETVKMWRFQNSMRHEVKIPESLSPGKVTFNVVINGIKLIPVTAGGYNNNVFYIN